jgi:hypothetical protein
VLCRGALVHVVHVPSENGDHPSRAVTVWMRRNPLTFSPARLRGKGGTFSLEPESSNRAHRSRHLDDGEVICDVVNGVIRRVRKTTRRRRLPAREFGLTRTAGNAITCRMRPAAAQTDIVSATIRKRL